jgi:transcriptional regulator with XRE-family HTH domain
MDIKGEIRALLAKEGTSMRSIELKIGMSAGSLRQILSRNSLRYDTAKKIAKILDYKLEFYKNGFTNIVVPDELRPAISKKAFDLGLDPATYIQKLLARDVS